MTGTAIVTGAAMGIGRTVAEQFAAQGWSVLCADTNETGARDVAANLRAQGFEARATFVDVTSEDSCNQLVRIAMDWTGKVTTLSANAGIMVEGDALGLSLLEWTRAMDTNVKGAFLCARAVLRVMVKARAGSIVFTTDTAGMTGTKAAAAHAASNGAVVALTRQLAADYAAHGIRVNAIAPDAVRTPHSDARLRAGTTSEAEFATRLAESIDRHPIQRWGTGFDAAEAVLFLAGEGAGWITGQILPIDGGRLQVR